MLSVTLYYIAVCLCVLGLGLYKNFKTGSVSVQKMTKTSDAVFLPQGGVLHNMNVIFVS